MGSPLDFYELLNIPKNSTPEEIRNAYKILAKKWHPDKHPPSSKLEAEARFKAIIHAYERLLDLYKSKHEENQEREIEKLSSKHVDSRTRNFKDFVYTNASKSFNDYHYARIPQSDYKEHNYSKNLVRENYSKGAQLNKSFSGQLLRKPPPEERKLECTLEELRRGCKKEIKFSRSVIGKNGENIQKQESEIIRIKPGWRKGTRITFEGMGDERPGYLPSDVVFLISEKEHPVFKRVRNDLILKVEIPLVNALTGWKFSFRALTGEKMTCSFVDEIIYPGYEKVIEGQGMPIANEKGKRGDLRIKFKIVFPTKLSPEKKCSITEIFEGATGLQN